MSDKHDLFDVFFNGRKPQQDIPPRPATTDKPNIKLFMLQMIRQYSGLTSSETMAWEATFRDKLSGKKYEVIITLTEKENV